MPLSSAALLPDDEITGTSALPMARVRKIINTDEDIAQCSKNATFAIAVATEMFIQYLSEQAHNVVKSEKKPRKTIQYKDLATAVSRIDNLEFLSDVIPKTTTYKQFKEKKAREARESAVEAGQTRLGNNTPAKDGLNGDGAARGDRGPGVESDSVLRISEMLAPTANAAASEMKNEQHGDDSDVEMHS